MNKGPSQTKNIGIELPTIIWDGLGLFQEHSGVGSYAANLYKACIGNSVTPKITSFDHEKLSYCSDENLIKIKGRRPHSIRQRISQLKPIFPIKSYTEAKKHTKRMIFHGLSNINLPVLGNKRSNDRFVITVHDIIPLLIAKKSPLALQMQYLLPRVVGRADWIITGSKWTRDLLIDRYGAHVEKKIEAVGYGVNSRWIDNNTPKVFDAVMISRGETYKRLEIFKDIAKRCPERKFVLVTDQIGVRMVNDHTSNLIVKSKISDEEVAETIISSKIMIHPALYEGWCLPVADAISYGLDVIYCGGSGIDEVCSHSQNTAIKMQKTALVEHWTEAFIQIVKDHQSTQKESTLPSWSEIASKTLKIYKTLVQ